MTNEKTKTWAAFGSDWIKAVDVLNNTDEYVIVDVSSQVEDKNGVQKEVIILDIERDGFKKKFGCNATNQYALQQAFPESPESAIGAKITFNKVKVNKPGSNPPEEVDGLRLVFPQQKVEEPAEVDTDEAGIEEDSTM